MFTVEIDTTRTIGTKFDQFPEAARGRLRAAIESLIAILYPRVVGEEPSATGKLRSETDSRVEETATRVTGAVSVTGEFAKAASLEYGAHGTTMVKAHSASLDHVYGKFVAPMSVMIGEHSRRLNVAEHRYLRGPLHAMEGQIHDAMQQALDEAAQD